MRQVQIYSRHGCHLCDDALQTLKNLQNDMNFEIQEIFIDGDSELEQKYGQQVPVIHIDNRPHDFYTVNPKLFKAAFAESHPHQ